MAPGGLSGATLVCMQPAGGLLNASDDASIVSLTPLVQGVIPGCWFPKAAGNLRASQHASGTAPEYK